MILHPEVLALHREDCLARLDLRIPEDLTYFSGHFPGLPVLPGVVQVHWAANLGRAQFELPPRFRRLSALKFMRVLRPGLRPTLELRYPDARGDLAFRYTGADGDYSSGRIGYVHD